MAFWGDLVKAVRSSVFRNELKNGGFQVEKAEKADQLTTVLPIVRGGTGAMGHRKNAIITGGGNDNPLIKVPTANGACYATGVDQPLRFGALPIAQGGTGASTALGALQHLGVTHRNIELTLNDDDEAYWYETFVDWGGVIACTASIVGLHDGIAATGHYYDIGLAKNFFCGVRRDGPTIEIEISRALGNQGLVPAQGTVCCVDLIIIGKEIPDTQG